MELSENQKLKFIEASYHTASDLDPEKTDFVLNLMTQRFNDSKRSFSLLYYTLQITHREKTLPPSVYPIIC